MDGSLNSAMSQKTRNCVPIFEIDSLEEISEEQRNNGMYSDWYQINTENAPDEDYKDHCAQEQHNLDFWNTRTFGTVAIPLKVNLLGRISAQYFDIRNTYCNDFTPYISGHPGITPGIAGIPNTPEARSRHHVVIRNQDKNIFEPYTKYRVNSEIIWGNKRNMK